MYTPHDKFFQKAKDEGYRARSAYKLLAIQKKRNVIRPEDFVLDLGAAPGAFMQIACKIVGSQGKIVGIDLTPIQPFDQENMQTFVADIFDDAKVDEVLKASGIEKFDVMLSDLAPKTSGRKDVDQWRSVELTLQALKICDKYLRKGGCGLFKVFRGEDFHDVVLAMKKRFREVFHEKPGASRKNSVEIYLVGFGFQKDSVLFRSVF